VLVQPLGRRRSATPTNYDAFGRMLEGEVALGRDASPSMQMPGHDLRDPVYARTTQRSSSFVVAVEDEVWEVFGGAKGSVVMPPTDSQAVTLMSAKEASARSSAPGRMIKSANIVESTTVFNEKPCAVQTDRGGSYYSLEAALSARLRDMTNTVRDSPNALRRLLSA